MEERQLKLDTRLDGVDCQLLSFTEVSNPCGISGRLATMERGQRAVAEALERALRIAISVQQEQQQSGNVITVCAQRLDAYDQQIAKLDATFREFVTRQETADHRTKKQDNKMALQAKQIDEQDTRMSQLCEELKALAADVQSTREAECKQWERRLCDQEHNLKRLSQAVTTLAGDRPKISINASLSAWKAQVNEHAQHLQELSCEVSALAEKLEIKREPEKADDVLAHRVDCLDQQISELHENVLYLVKEASRTQNCAGSWSAMVHVDACEKKQLDDQVNVPQDLREQVALRVPCLADVDVVGVTSHLVGPYSCHMPGNLVPESFSAHEAKLAQLKKPAKSMVRTGVELVDRATHPRGHKIHTSQQVAIHPESALSEPEAEAMVRKASVAESGPDRACVAQVVEP